MHKKSKNFVIIINAIAILAVVLNITNSEVSAQNLTTNASSGITPSVTNETYNSLNKNIQDGTVNATNFINEVIVGSVENFNKTLELTQRYYNDILQNNFNYARKIERSYNR